MAHIADYVVIQDSSFELPRPYAGPLLTGWARAARASAERQQIWQWLHSREPCGGDSVEFLYNMGAKFLCFSLPDGTVLNERAIIAFVANPSSDADELEYDIVINNESVTSGSFTGGVKRGLWGVVPAGRLNEGARNGILFWTNGESSVKFSDVILWFQRSI